MSTVKHPARARELLAALDDYRPARRALLATLKLTMSNRDPLAEFSEQLVHALMGGTLAESRVQAGHDLALLDGHMVQVRYLANPSQTWVNEHLVYGIPGVDRYALVLFEHFAVVGVLVFPTTNLLPICEALGKRALVTYLWVGLSASHTGPPACAGDAGPPAYGRTPHESRALRVAAATASGRP